jgi:hypothetical protein
MPATNDAELMAMMMGDFTLIIDEVSKELLEKLLEVIHAVVYDPFHPKKYNRLGDNGGLLDDWDKTNPVISGNTIESEISEYPDRMVLDAPGFTHGSLYYDPNDVRDFLSELIIEGKSGDLFGEGFWRSSRDFWTPFLQLIDDGTADRIIEKAMNSRGIKWIKI